LLLSFVWKKIGFNKSGERLAQLSQLFDNRCGCTVKDAVVPAWFMRSVYRQDGKRKGWTPTQDALYFAG